LLIEIPTSAVTMASVVVVVDAIAVADTMLVIFLFLFPELHVTLHINLLVADFDGTNENKLLAVYTFNFSETPLIRQNRTVPMFKIVKFN